MLIISSSKLLLLRVSKSSIYLTVSRGSKSPALAGDLPLYSSFLSYLPLSQFSLASSRYDGNRRGHAHFAGARRRSSGFAALDREQQLTCDVLTSSRKCREMSAKRPSTSDDSADPPGVKKAKYQCKYQKSCSCQLILSSEHSMRNNMSYYIVI